MRTLQTPSLRLRPYEALDAGAFALAARESFASVNPWLPWCHAGYSESEALEWFRATEDALKSGAAHEFGVFSSDGRSFLGAAGLNQINIQHRFCNLGYWVRQSAQRQGVALACVQALVDYAFSTLQLHRVEIVVALGNHASAGVARKAGAQFECVARNRLFIHGTPVSASVFSLVPADEPGR